MQADRRRVGRQQILQGGQLDGPNGISRRGEGLGMVCGRPTHLPGVRIGGVVVDLPDPLGGRWRRRWDSPVVGQHHPADLQNRGAGAAEFKGSAADLPADGPGVRERSRTG